MFQNFRFFEIHLETLIFQPSGTDTNVAYDYAFTL